ncbi:MAG: RNA polymerase sigma-70 factor [Bacteroidales bacterium]
MKDSQIAFQQNQVRFRAIFKQHYAKIVYYAMSFLHNEEKAKGIAQEVFASVWENIDKLEEEIQPYLFVLAKRRCLNTIRREKYKAEHKEFIAGNTIDREISYLALRDSCIENLLESEVNKIFKETLDLMPQKTKEAFCLNRFKNLTYKEIANIQGVSAKNIEYRIMSALRILRINLQEFLPVYLGILFYYVY